MTSTLATFKPLVSPLALAQRWPITSVEREIVRAHQNTVKGILSGKDPRRLAIVGPCSIHDTDAALEYAQRFKALSEELNDALFMVMRVYPEKPRSLLGWKGLINDPHLNGTFDIAAGIERTRALMVELVKADVPIATEIVTPLLAPYFEELLTWVAIGARTSESPLHREMASGLAMPVGFKNATDGSVKHAIYAIQAARSGHHSVTLLPDGQCGIVETPGNPYGHLVLRGSDAGINYDRASVEQAAQALQTAGIPTRLIVDCSHGNSQKKAKNQVLPLTSLVEQIRSGNQAIAGFMLESFLVEGNQSLTDKAPLVYGQSITDECLSWEHTSELLRETAHALP